MMEELEVILKRVLAGKEAQRRENAALPYPEKVRRVVEMQKRVAPILAEHGIKVRIWDLDQAEGKNESAEK